MGADKNFFSKSGYYPKTTPKPPKAILPRSRSHCQATDPRNKMNTAELESIETNTNRTKTDSIQLTQEGAVKPGLGGG